MITGNRPHPVKSGVSFEGEPGSSGIRLFCAASIEKRALPVIDLPSPGFVAPWIPRLPASNQAAGPG